MVGYHTPTPAGIPELWIEGYGSMNTPHLRGEHSPEQLAAAAAVGYHNHYRCNDDVIEEQINRACPPGWQAFIDHELGGSVPPGAVRVGQVRYRQGDRDYIIYIIPTTT